MDFVAFNAALWEKCEKDAEQEHYRKKRLIRDLWEEERGKPLKLPDTPYEVFRYTSAAVNKRGFATVDTNRQSGILPMERRLRGRPPYRRPD